MIGSIKSWNEEERPREKLLQKGAAALTDAELLALLISTGSKEKSALDLARETLALAQNDLQELGRLSIDQLRATKGIGEAKAITIAAALELGRRRQSKNVSTKKSFTQSQEIAAHLAPLMQDLSHEVMWVLYLNNSLKLIKQEMISSGGMSATVVDVRMILKQALVVNSNHLILSHNHPSGNVVPSEADKRLTKKLHDSALLMDIKLIDHLIMAGNSYYSFADEGLL